jgi:hypothetical protein
MLQRLGAKSVAITERRDRRDLETLFEQVARIDVLQSIESTEVGKKLARSYQMVRTSVTRGISKGSIEMVESER